MYIIHICIYGRTYTCTYIRLNKEICVYIKEECKATMMVEKEKHNHMFERPHRMMLEKSMQP